MGLPNSPERFGQLEGDIYEFKAYQNRLPCFFQPGRVIVITHGFTKKTQKADPREIRRAEQDRARFIDLGANYE